MTMTQKHYNILWIDDQWEEQQAFIRYCSNHEIYITPFALEKDGMQAFESMIDYWDGVILDAKGLTESEKEVASLSSLRAAVDRLNRLSSKRDVPYYILTGQPDLISSENFQQLFGNFYIKDNDESEANLIKDIKLRADELIETRVRQEFQSPCVFIKENSPEKYHELIEALKAFKGYPSTCILESKNPNDYRQYLEVLCEKCYQKGILPKSIAKGASLNECMRFLWDSSISYVPAGIKSLLRFADDYTQKGSHYYLQYKLEYIHIVGISAIINLLSWGSTLVDPTEDQKQEISQLAEKISSNSSDKKTFTGLVDQDGYGNFYSEDCIIKCSGIERLFGKTVTIKAVINKNYPEKEPYEFYCGWLPTEVE